MGPDIIPTILPGREVLDWGWCDVINYVLSLVRAIFRLGGVIGLIAFLWGVLQYLFAFGSDEKISHAKMVMYYSIIGILLMACSIAIIGLVWQLFGNSPLDLRDFFFSGYPADQCQS